MKFSDTDIDFFFNNMRVIEYIVKTVFKKFLLYKQIVFVNISAGKNW